MKKTIILILASFYLIIASGITISLHYCGGKLKEISLFSPNDENGCCGTKKRSKGCCNEKTVFIKVKDDHQSKYLLKTPEPSSKQLLSFIPNFQEIFVLKANTNDEALNFHEPPELYDNPLYLQHRVLLI